jgi:hypothetical protein
MYLGTWRDQWTCPNALAVDAPCGLKPDGCSGYAHGAPSRSLLKGLPGWTGDRIARRARLDNNSGASAAHLVHHTVLLFPMGTMARGTAKQHASIGEAHVSYRSLLTPGEDYGNGAGTGSGRTRLTARVETRRLAAGEIPLHVRAIRQRPCFPRNQYLWSRVFVYAVAPVCLSL